MTPIEKAAIEYAKAWRTFMADTISAFDDGRTWVQYDEARKRLLRAVEAGEFAAEVTE